MERLTIRSKNSDMVWFKDAENGNAHLEPCEMTAHHNRMTLDKLSTYEDAEEYGLLLWLPCKVGDSVYRFWYVDEKPYKVQKQVIRTLANLVAIMESGELGKSVFLSLEEAENKLKEMESSHAENRSV